MKSTFFYLLLILGIFNTVVLHAQDVHYKAVPLPVYTPPIHPGFTDTGITKYEITTGKTHKLLIKSPDVAYPDFQPPSISDVSNEFAKSGVQPYKFSNIEPADEVAGFPEYPFSAVVRIVMEFQDPGNGEKHYFLCSGTLINSSYVLTAGHCVTGSEDLRLTGAAVQPAYNMKNAPYGNIAVVEWYSFNRWINNNDYDYDIALLRLEKPVGNTTGYLGFGHADAVFFTNSNNNFNSIGYPSSDNGVPVFEKGERMYYMSGYMDFLESQSSVCNNNKGYNGQSGSGLYYKDDDGSRYVLGVLSHGSLDKPYYTCHTILDKSKFDYLLGIIKGDSDNDHTAIAGADKPIPVTIYPNPSSGIFYLDLSKVPHQKIDLTVSDLLGKELMSVQDPGPNRKVLINLSNQPNGLYFIKGTIGKETIYGRLVKIW